MQSLAYLLSFIHILKKSILKKKSHREKFKYSVVIFSLKHLGARKLMWSIALNFFFFLPHSLAYSSPTKDQTWTVSSESTVLTTGLPADFPSLLSLFQLYWPSPVPGAYPLPPATGPLHMLCLLPIPTSPLYLVNSCLSFRTQSKCYHLLGHTLTRHSISPLTFSSEKKYSCSFTFIWLVD